jgi:hypothetical protein|tara:strand:- start:141 stop:812 length:672 start_codon:yes stop_codon:yes gene_type:complete
MAVRPIILERIPNAGDVVTISKSGISFSAAFIKGKKLHTMASVGFFIDDNDSYKLLFKLYDEEGLPNTLVLLKSGRGGVSYGRTVKAQELFSKNRVLSSIQKLTTKSSRTFDIKFDKFDGYYFISLRPSFENFVLVGNSSSLPSSANGIYRYLDKSGDVIYIGKGNIKSRLQSTERKTWGINKIEYSILNSEDDSFKWESFYIDEYQNQFGLLPTFNRISGHG